MFLFRQWSVSLSSRYFDVVLDWGVFLGSALVEEKGRKWDWSDGEVEL